MAVGVVTSRFSGAALDEGLLCLFGSHSHLSWVRDASRGSAVRQYRLLFLDGGGWNDEGIELRVLHSLGGFGACSGYGSSKRHKAPAGTP